MNLIKVGLLLLCLSSVLCVDDDGPAPVAGMVRKTGSVRGKDGSVAHVTKLTDVRCQLEQETTEEQDGSVSAIIKDFTKGKSVLLKSKAPDMCYVRDIPQDEMEVQERNCVDGQTELSPDSPREERVYAESEEVAEEELSDDLAQPCKGRRLVALKEVKDTDTESAKRGNKRECRTVITQRCRNELVSCSNQCIRYGWWWGSNSCKEYKYKCDYAERCNDHHNTICT